MTNWALKSNGAIATADSDDGYNVPNNAIDGSLTTGNGYNWYGGNKLMVTLKGKKSISSMKIMTTENWGVHCNTFDLYYTLDDSLDVNSELSKFKKVGTFKFNNTNDTLEEIKFDNILVGKKFMIIPEIQNKGVAVVEFELWGNDFVGVILQSNKNYYSIDEKYYNSSAKNYNAISDLSVSNFNNYEFNVSDLFKEITINEETFKPIDKFKSFSIISTSQNTLNINGIKVDKSMISTIEPLSMAAYETIHNITADYTIENNGAIKLIFSFDKGNTWKTYDVSTNAWNHVSVNIPTKLYDNFTSEEKSNWDSARDIILSDGISIQNLGNVVFSTETIKTLMFAVAFSRHTYADTCTLRGLNIKYDGVITYIQLAVGSDLTKYEAKVRITGDTIGVTSSTNCDKLLISVVTNI
jgi:hypothetical protein